MSIRHWKPFSLTSAAYAVLVLNQPIKIKLTSFQKIWDSAVCRISVDGGTNHLFQVEQNNIPNLRPPHLITGDLDSILPPVKKHYEALGTKIVKTPDQNYTDFTKAIKELFAGSSRGDYPDVKSVFVINEPSGRHDQFFANISTLTKFRRETVPIFIVSEESMSWVMTAGAHKLSVHKDYVAGSPFCGLIPLCGKTKLKTEGLRWNLNESMNCSFEDGGIVSTSNEITSDSVEIQTDKDILWTMKAFLC